MYIKTALVILGLVTLVAFYRKQNLIISKQFKIMGKLDDLNAKLDRQDAAIADVTADLHFVKDQISGGLTAAEADTLGARLDASIAKLEALGGETDSTPAPAPEPTV